MFRAYIAFWSADPARSGASPETMELNLSGYRQPISLRLCTSDVLVSDQVFCHEEYAPLTHVVSPKLIIDCGANIGCTSAYLLHHHPSAKLIAVEPDLGNSQMCIRNLKPFGVQAVVLQAGVWCRPASLCVERGAFRDGKEWSFQVRECAVGEPAEVQAVSISSLIDQAGADRVDILKIDVEGAERVLFAEGMHDWLDRVECLAIETHDNECFNTVLGAVRRHSFSHIVRRRETLFCFRRPMAMSWLDSMCKVIT
jgi:FkbM family methyltransferase